MTEEQKEYEANKLANMIHQLHELGAMKPGKIGPDGKPVAVEHVLELVEGQQFRRGEQNDESDSDWICMFECFVTTYLKIDLSSFIVLSGKK